MVICVTIRATMLSLNAPSFAISTSSRITFDRTFDSSGSIDCVWSSNSPLQHYLPFTNYHSEGNGKRQIKELALLFSSHSILAFGTFYIGT